MLHFFQTASMIWLPGSAWELDGRLCRNAGGRASLEHSKAEHWNEWRGEGRGDGGKWLKIAGFWKNPAI